MSKKSRVLLVRVGAEEIRRVGDLDSGVVVKVIVTHANMKVELEDDFGGVVEHRRAELVCPE